MIINYENAPEQYSLDTLHTPAQIDAFQTTIDNITDTYHAKGQQVYWAPPWSQNHDPIGNGTWQFIYTQLNKGNP